MTSKGYFNLESIELFEHLKSQRVMFKEIEAGAFYRFMGTNRRIGGVALSANMFVQTVEPSTQMIEAAFVNDDHLKPSETSKAMVVDGFWLLHKSKVIAQLISPKGPVPYEVDYGYLIGADHNAETRLLSELADQDLLVV